MLGGGALLWARSRSQTKEAVTVKLPASPPAAPPPAAPPASITPPSPPPQPKRSAPSNLSSPPQAAPVSSHPSAVDEIPRIEWHGGTGQDNQEALGWMLASENPRSTELVWFLQVLVINNRARARASLGIKSIRELLQSGVLAKKLRLNLGWGPQVDLKTGVVRIASTSAALKGKPIPSRIVRFVAELMSGKLDPRALRGPTGEQVPPATQWTQLTDFLQHRNFDRTVWAQLGGKAGRTEAQVLESWGNPAQLIEVDGLRFYGKQPRGSQPRGYA